MPEPSRPADEFVLSPSQTEAQASVAEWYGRCQEDFDLDSRSHTYDKESGDFTTGSRSSLSQPIYRLFGYAGTGKTTVIRSTIAALAEEFGSCRCGFAAYTGKAALIMRKQGLRAKTVHSLIYKVVPPPEDKIRELEAKIKAAADSAERKRLRAELREVAQPTFELNEESELYSMDLLVLDECSMINDEMLTDLLFFNIPLLVLGDPGQLPPIHGFGALMSAKPDTLLTEIHRQAQGNPIIDFATRARNGIPIRYGKFVSDTGSAEHMPIRDLTEETIMSVDQVLCGKNVTRRTLNSQMRAALGYENHLPQNGDKLICLRNDIGKGLFNGLMCEVVDVLDLLDTSILLLIHLETGGKPIKVEALRAHFDAYIDADAMNNVRWYDRARCDEFDFGYAITVHKAQGSQWDSVLLYDDGFLSWKRDERKKWLYTACTRAAERLIIVD